MPYRAEKFLIPVVRIFLFLLTIILGQMPAGHSQTAPSLQPTLTSVNVPSPSAYAITKFGDVPVSPSTGIPNISVPLFSFSNPAGLNMNVSLDYHAGGVRVDDIASVAGIGWALKTGGVITRNMRGIFDEFDAFGFIDNTLPNSELDGNTGSDPSNRPYNRIANDILDGQNDIFSYSFGAYSGKFQYGKGGVLLISNLDKLVIEKTESFTTPGSTGSMRISAFTITDPKGYKYFFDAYEVTDNHGIGTAGGRYTSAWYLTKIQPPSGVGPILLEYESTTATYYTGWSFMEALRFPGLTTYFPDYPASGGFQSQTVYGKRIRYIHLPNGVKLTFDYSTTEKTDANGEYLLKKISISNASGVRGYKLAHDNSLNRPTLLSVTPFAGVAETPDQGYAFEYDAPLPDRLSHHQDHWGFYNSNPSGKRIPSEILNVGTGGQYGQWEEYSGGDRSTSAILCKAGSLKRVKYPTGGYTDYEFEANTAVDPRLDTRMTVVKQIYSREDAVTAYASSTATHSTTFNFQGDPGTATEFTVQVPSNGYTCTSGCKVVLEIRSPTGLLLDIRYIDPPTSSFQPPHLFTLNNLTQGNHTITTYTQGVVSGWFAYITFKWKEVRIQNPIEETRNLGRLELYVGGLRAKKISDYDGISTVPAKVREYEYLMEDGTTSSGTLGFYPKYSYPVFYDWRTPPASLTQPEQYFGQSGARNYFVRSTSTVWPLAYSQGAPVAYKRVVEKVTVNGVANGKKVSYFSSFETSPVIILTSHPFTPPNYKDWTNGRLEEVRYYNQADQLVKKETFNYQHFEYSWPTADAHTKFMSVSIAPVKYVTNVVGTDPPYWTIPVYYRGNTFYPIAGRMEMIGKTAIEYDVLGNTLTNSEVYTYDPDHFHLKSTSTTDSRGKQQIRQFKFPKDKVTAGQDPTGIFQAMVQKNMLQIPVEEIRKEDTAQLERHIVNFFRPYTDVIVPQTMQSQYKWRPIENRIQFSAYNVAGNILEQRKTQGENQVYLWGYNQQYPVAVISGSTWAAASALVNQSLLDAPTDDPTLRNLLNVLRTLPASLVKTYTYNPLLGLTSQTDERGRTSYFEYDGFGRLKLTRDHDQKIQQVIDYKYQSNP